MYRGGLAGSTLSKSGLTIDSFRTFLTLKLGLVRPVHRNKSVQAACIIFDIQRIVSKRVKITKQVSNGAIRNPNMYSSSYGSPLFPVLHSSVLFPNNI